MRTPVALAVGVARLAASAASALVRRDQSREVAPRAPERPLRREPPPTVEHVSEESTLVAATAEPGAEQGAGAEVNVEEPWKGYSRMTAAQVIARLRREGRAAAAAVSLYEASHKGRTSVLEAAARGVA